MPLNPMQTLDNLEARLNRAHALTCQIQRVALESEVTDAEDGLNMIDALSDALAARLQGMVEDVEAAARCLLEASTHYGAMSEAFGTDFPRGADDDG